MRVTCEHSLGHLQTVRHLISPLLLLRCSPSFYAFPILSTSHVSLSTAHSTSTERHERQHPRESCSSGRCVALHEVLFLSSPSFVVQHPPSLRSSRRVSTHVWSRLSSQGSQIPFPGGAATQGLEGCGIDDPGHGGRTPAHLEPAGFASGVTRKESIQSEQSDASL